MTSLHWGYPLAGGLLIGLSAALLLLLEGRIAGISGLVASALGLSRAGSRRLSIAFLSGLLVAAAGMMAALGRAPLEVDGRAGWLVVGGLLVGYGTRLGSGCTSGHGVCGMARLSRRSLAATAIFMVVAAVTVWLVRHVAGGGT